MAGIAGTHHFFLSIPVRGGQFVEQTTDPFTEPTSTTTEAAVTTTEPPASSSSEPPTSTAGTAGSSTTEAPENPTGIATTEVFETDFSYDITSVINTGLTAVVDVPPSEPGDLLYAFVYRGNNNNGCSPPDGWTTVYDSTAGLGNVSRYFVFRKTQDEDNSTTTDAATFTFTFSGSGANAVEVIAIHNMGSEQAHLGQYIDGNGNNITLSAVTTILDNSLVLSNMAISDPANVSTSDLTMLQHDNDGSTGSAMGVAGNLQPTAGSTGTVTWGSSGSAQRRAGIVIAVNPRPDPEFRGSTQGTLADVSDTDATLALDNLIGGVGPHQYWRLLATSYNGDSGEEWERLKFMYLGSEVTTASMTWSATSTFSGYGANKVSNPPSSPGWASNFSSGTPQGVTVNAGSPINVDQIKLTPHQANRAPGSFTVDYSDDGSTWTNAFTFGSGSGWSNGVERSFDIPTLLPIMEVGDQMFLAVTTAGTGGGAVKPVPPAGWVLKQGEGFLHNVFLWVFEKKATGDDILNTTIPITFTGQTESLGTEPVLGGGSNAQLIVFHGAITFVHQDFLSTVAPNYYVTITGGFSGAANEACLYIAAASLTGLGAAWVGDDGTTIEAQNSGTDIAGLYSMYKVTVDSSAQAGQIQYDHAANMLTVGFRLI